MFFHLYYSVYRKTLKGRKQTNMEGGQSGTYLRLTRDSSGPRASVAKTYRDETKLNENEYFGQNTGIQETEAKFLSAAKATVECGGLTDIETGVVS